MTLNVGGIFYSLKRCKVAVTRLTGQKNKLTLSLALILDQSTTANVLNITNSLILQKCK